MSPEIENEMPQSVPQDIFLANCFAWHAAQPFFRPAQGQKVQPQLRFAAPPMEAPIELEIHPDGTFPAAGRDPWAYAFERQLYGGSKPGVRISEYAIRVADIEPENPSPLEYARTPDAIIVLSGLSALYIGRPDLDDNERRYLHETQYYVWLGREMLRQDVFQIDDERHIVPVKPLYEEVKKLHDVAFCPSFCACAMGVYLNHYAPLNTWSPLASSAERQS